MQRRRLWALITCVVSSLSEGNGRAPPASHTEHALLVICTHRTSPHLTSSSTRHVTARPGTTQRVFPLQRCSAGHLQASF